MKLMMVRLVVSCLIASASVGLLQGENSSNASAAAANLAYQDKDWAKATPLYQQLAQAQPANPQFSYRLGVCLQKTGQPQKAIQSFQNSQAKGFPVSVTGYNIAEAYA